MAQAKIKDGEEKVNPLNAVKDFLLEVKAEAKKIAWPSREVLYQSTMTVLSVILALTFIMAILDLSLNFVINLM